MAAARKNSAPIREVDDFDQVDVPATVICALCGDAECPGCANERSRSGIVALIAWERARTPLFSRLWTTARAATLEADAFFAVLPDGPVAPAFRFAVLCELIAASAMLLAGLPLVAFVAPGWLKHMVLSEGWLCLRLLVLGIPALAALLVAAHAAHGVALDRGARRMGARAQSSRALRFGLYAAGWDLVLGPLGAVVLCVKESVGAARSAEGPLRLSYVAAVIATIIGAVAILGAGVAIALA
jgi:hypothetical protein